MSGATINLGLKMKLPVLNCTSINSFACSLGQRYQIDWGNSTTSNFMNQKTRSKKRRSQEVAESGIKSLPPLSLPMLVLPCAIVMCITRPFLRNSQPSLALTRTWNGCHMHTHNRWSQRNEPTVVDSFSLSLHQILLSGRKYKNLLDTGKIMLVNSLRPTPHPQHLPFFFFFRF